MVYTDKHPITELSELSSVTLIIAPALLLTRASPDSAQTAG